MRPGLRRLFLRAVSTDNEAQFADGVWETRCLHCRTRLQVAADGEPRGSASLEHVIPRAWFSKRSARPLIERVGGDPDDARNLAVACTRCNHDKGKGPDARGPLDARAREVVEALLATRLARWREPSGPDGGR
ncbi:HNH endonuclease [Lysobacter korlensis]|uniref:HNH endonuclease n=1 Tax=Lysobacter korlensis TaxID=553636 RepID=A0ABV6RJY2_9GAMM